MSGAMRQPAVRVVMGLCAILMSWGWAFGDGETSVFDDPTAMPKPGVAVPAAPVKPGPANAGADNAALKVAPPDAAAKAQMLKMVKQIYDKEYGQKSPGSRRQLAGELLAEAGKIKVNFAARFVLLQEVVAAATGASDVSDCQKAIDGLDETFNFDTAVMTIDAINKLSEAGADDTAVATFGVEAVEHHIDEDDYAGARHISKGLSSKIARAKDPALLVKFKAMEAVLAEYDRVHLALEKLKADPNDPAANSLGGKFYCFYRHDWNRGLPKLARGTDAKLKELATKDLSNPNDSSARYELAGQWWDLAHDKIHASLQPMLHERASYWYEKALPDLAGVPKAMAEKRLAELEEEGVSSVNVVRKMVTEGKSQLLPDGSVRLDNGSLQWPTQLAVPFRIDAVVKTTSNMCSIRFYYANGGIIIFNWEDNPSELRYHDPNNNVNAFKGKGTVPIDQFVHITWILTQDGSRIIVDGEERANVKGDHKNLAGFFRFNIWNHPGIVVKSVSVTRLAATAGEH